MKRKPRRSGGKKLRLAQTSGKIRFRLIAVCIAAFAIVIGSFILKDLINGKEPGRRPIKTVREVKPAAPKPATQNLNRPGAAPAHMPGPSSPVVPLPPSQTRVLKQVTLTQAEIERPKIVFVIDDIGYHLDFEEEIRALGNQVTYAILPRLPYSEHFGLVGGEMGAEVILHQPLETVDGTIPGKGLITSVMPPEQMIEMLHGNLATVPNHIGINNHMGSLGTTNPGVMRTLLAELRKNGMIFLDSRTNSKSIGPEIAAELDMVPLVRDVFLDNQEDKPSVLGQVQQLEPIARQKGYAIGIGHYKKNTLEVIADEIPKLKQKGFAIVTLSKIAVMKERDLL